MNLAIVLAWLAPLICLVSAVSDQEQSIGVEATEVPVLVEVTGDLRFVPFVPKVENRANISVSLAVPASALSHLSAGNLTVYLMLKPKRADSQLYFAPNPQAKEHYLTLNCTVVGGACAPGSVTSRTIGVYFNAPTEASLAGDEVIVHASLSPLIAEQSSSQGEFSVDPAAYSRAVALWEQASNPPQASQAAAVVQTFTVKMQDSSQNRVSAAESQGSNSGPGGLAASPNQSASYASGRLLSYSASGQHQESGNVSVQASEPVAAFSGLYILRPEPTIANFLFLACVFLAVLKADDLVRLLRNALARLK